MDKFCGNIDKDSNALGELIGAGESYDVKQRRLDVSGRAAYFCCISSLISDQLTERLISRILSADVRPGESAESFGARVFPFKEVKFCESAKDAAADALEGSGVLLVDGFERALSVELKNIPSRGIEEPESDRVLRGSRDGFTENLIDNTALLRHRLSNAGIVYKLIPVGESAKTNVLVCFMPARADMDFVTSIEKKLSGSKVDALSMSSESLAEALIKKRWFDPFPKVRYTERPDAACAMLLEGSVILLCDNSPQAMILPCSVFDFMQETDDFYFPPLTGTYLRLLRFIIFLLSYLLVPVWYLCVRHPEYIPEALSFIRPESSYELPIILQILLIEFTIDGLKLASMNTPGSLSNSLSIVAGLLLGDFAIQVGWLIPEVILYMSFVAMANFTQPSFELGYAFKFMRIILLVLISIFDLAGFVAGIIIAILAVTLNRTVDGSRGYLYPVIPFNKRAFVRMIFRVRLKEEDGKKQKR